MALHSSVSVSSATASVGIPLNPEKSWAASVQVSGTFVGTYNVEYTLDQQDTPLANQTWLSAPTGNALTAPATVIINFPVFAVRLNCTAYTSGTIVMKVVQGTNAE